MAAEVLVTYHAKEQFNRLSAQERTALNGILNESGSLELSPGAGKTGRYVSRLGTDKRVLWTKSDDGRIIVLSVVVKQPAQNESRQDPV